MTTARRRLVDPAVTRWYHCISRCVRRAFLLGAEGVTNRKAWIQNRLQELCEVFSVTVAGFSILENYLHVDRLGTTAELWEQRLTQLKTTLACCKLTGRFLATTRRKTVFVELLT